jgi:hypothetical protein
MDRLNGEGDVSLVQPQKITGSSREPMRIMVRAQGFNEMAPMGEHVLLSRVSETLCEGDSMAVVSILVNR